MIIGRVLLPAESVPMDAAAVAGTAAAAALPAQGSPRSP